MMSEWLAGRHPILEALRSGQEINKILIAEGVKKEPLRPILALAQEKRVVVQTVHRQKLAQLVPGVEHQGIAAALSAHGYADWSTVETLAASLDMPLFLVLDGIEDPHNLGSILRSADAAGVDAVIIPKRRAVGLTQVVAKTSAGAVAYVPVVRVTNLAQAVDRLKALNVWVMASDFGGENFHEIDYRLPLALIIGNEGKGVSPLLRKKCDRIATIPMKGQVASLNASVAAAVMLFEVMRQRG
jgi:23S rRNA (guanosine2251-2'-O)-methyltransferase